MIAILTESGRMFTNIQQLQNHFCYTDEDVTHNHNLEPTMRPSMQLLDKEQWEIIPTATEWQVKICF